ncbi:MAG: zinc finger CCCH domain-containing protein, partial [Candidatus Fonsibacter sp.]
PKTQTEVTAAEMVVEKGKAKAKASVITLTSLLVQKTDDTQNTDGKKWCLAHMKGNCTKGDSCPNLHGDEGGKPANSGRSPSRDNKKSEWKPKADKSS